MFSKKNTWGSRLYSLTFKSESFLENWGIENVCVLLRKTSQKMQMSKQISQIKTMTWLPKLTFIIYNVRKDNQQRKHTHTKSETLLLPRHTLPKPKSSSTRTHLQILAGAATGLCWQTALPCLRLPSPSLFLCLPFIRPSLSTEAPQIQLSGGETNSGRPWTPSAPLQ